jgi:hypothetical protein
MGLMKGIFKRLSVGATGEASEKAREWRKKRSSTRERHAVRG